jgi:uncharacterized protein YuzE
MEKRFVATYDEAAGAAYIYVGRPDELPAGVDYVYVNPELAVDVDTTTPDEGAVVNLDWHEGKLVGVEIIFGQEWAAAK